MTAVEICASTIRDVAVAMEAGADRVELCSVWSVGGITPNVVVVEAAASMGMPVHALIRPREGSFVHTTSERAWAAEEAKVMLDCGAERVVVGGLARRAHWTRHIWMPCLTQPVIPSVSFGIVPLTPARMPCRMFVFCSTKESEPF